MSQIVDTAAIDVNRLIEEAKLGFLSVPLSQLPSFVQALLKPAMEEGQHHLMAEALEVALQHREVRRSEHVKDWLEEKSPEYQKAYEAFFDTVAESEVRLDGALFQLNESERQLGTRFAELTRRAVQLPNDRLAFYENGRFVYEDGTAVKADDLATCQRTKKEFDERHESITNRQEYIAVKDALADTVEVEQRVSRVTADVGCRGDEVEACPPNDKSDLQRNTLAIRDETDNAINQAAERYRQNQLLVSGQIELGNARERLLANSFNAADATTSSSFNASSAGTPLNPKPKPVALDLDQVIATAIAQAPSSAAPGMQNQ